MEESIKDKQSILNLEKRIESLEKGLMKAKTPLTLFLEEQWFKVDQIGHSAFSNLCKMNEEMKSKIDDLDYQIRDFNQFISIINSSKISKKERSEINKKLEGYELPIRLTPWK